VTCPCHGSQFDVTTGAVVRDQPAGRCILHPVEIEGRAARRS
jgi:Rieske Fe-S protein